jgi:hypothetical protein
MSRGFVKFAALAVFFLAPCCGADGPLEPVDLCEVLAKPDTYDGSVVAIVGRYSYRESGRFISEQSCETDGGTGPAWARAVRVVFDEKTAPALPKVYEIDAATLDRKLKVVKQRTSLAKIRFGSLDYDRWAVAYGRVVFRRDLHNTEQPAAVKKGGFEPAPAQLVCRGDGVIVFLTEGR